jgi:peptidoglycan hydrolase CwlO-like protein
MNNLYSRNNLRQISNWVWRGKFHLLTIFAVIITILYIIGVWDFHTNIVATTFSLIGLAIILRQLYLDASQFADQRSNTFRNWIMSFPTGKPLEVVVQDTLPLTSIARGHVMDSLPANATYDTKVDFLLKRVDNIQYEIVDVDNRIDEVNVSITEKTKELNTNIENHNKSLKTLIAGHPVGAYDVNLFGIVILICGTLIQFFSSLTT